MKINEFSSALDFYRENWPVSNVDCLIRYANMCIQYQQ